MPFFWDADRAISALFGSIAADASFQAHTYVLDPNLRVLLSLPMTQPAEAHVAALCGVLDQLPALPGPHRARPQAPVLVVPRVFEPGLCKALIEHYNARGGRDSGFMRDVDGKTVAIVDHSHKRRRDCDIEDQTLIRACMTRVHARLVPEVHKAFQFQATRMERYIVSCYDAAEAGHFNPHRDNTTLGHGAPALRGFAVPQQRRIRRRTAALSRIRQCAVQRTARRCGGVFVFTVARSHHGDAWPALHVRAVPA